VKIVVAPDSFKETLSAVEVACAVAAGVAEAAPDAEIDLCPMADGGEGTVEAMVAATGGEFRVADVFGPLGEARQARFGLLGSGKTACGERSRTAVIEMAAAAGLALVPPDSRNPMLTTTFGVGRLIRAALDAAARKLVIGIGGSATVDGGCGCAQALGVVFTGKAGRGSPCGLAGGGLADIGRIDMSSRDPRIAEADIRVACDVTNPLTGPEGAAAVYGPQKGATPAMVEQLDAGLANLAEVVRRDLGVDVEPLPGAGAAGGLGAGLVAFAGATLDSGVGIVAEAVGLARRAAGADLVITGEGRLDGQTASGKLPVGVAAIAADAGAKAVCIAGQVTADAPRELFAGVYPLVDGDVTVDDAMTDGADLIRRRAAEAVRRAVDL
jgi:glycerate kinase